MSSNPFLKTLLKRHSVYQLNKKLPVAKSNIVDIVRFTVENTPSSFNSQTTRAVVLFDKHHDKLWGDFVYNELKRVAPAEAFENHTAPKLKLFKEAAGTVLFFENTTKIKEMEEKFPLYAPKFKVWAGHSDGAAQILAWTALAEEGVGANLQHYNPLVDADVQKEWGVPEDWELVAQLVFGGIEKPAFSPEHLDPNETVKVFE